MAGRRRSGSASLRRLTMHTRNQVRTRSTTTHLAPLAERFHSAGVHSAKRHPFPPPPAAFPDPGIVEQIFMENFMCHKVLKIDLEPHINIITGSARARHPRDCRRSL